MYANPIKMLKKLRVMLMLRFLNRNYVAETIKLEEKYNWETVIRAFRRVWPKKLE